MSAKPLLWFLPAAMLLIGLAPLPYGYYQLMRLVVCVASAVLSWQEFQLPGRSRWAFALAALALLFNPVLPAHLSRGVWAALDFAAAVVLALHFARRRGVIMTTVRP